MNFVAIFTKKLTKNSIKFSNIYKIQGVSQEDPMSQLLPLLMLGEGEDSDNTDALMMLMMMNPGALNDPSGMIHHDS